MKKLLVLISLMLAAMLLLSSCSLIFRPTKPDEGGDFGDIGGNGGGEHVHAYGEWITEIPATCSADGLEKAVCHCGDVIVQPIPAVSHSFTEWNAANPPAGANACEWIPTYARICTSCGLTETKSDGVAPGHVWGEWSFVSSSATHNTYIRICKICGKSEFMQEEIGGTETHTFTEWSAANPPEDTSPCECDTVYVRVCTSCGLTETKVVAAPGHTWGEWSFVSSSATHNTYIRICKTCGNSEFKQEQIGGTETHTHKWDQTYEILFHTLNIGSAVAVCHCGECDYTVEITLPNIYEPASYHSYTPGNCLDTNDSYSHTVYNEIYQDFFGSSYIFFSFKVEAYYAHDAAPEKEDCVITEGDNYIYYSYICSKCDQYIIAYTEEKLPETPRYSVGLEYQLSSDGTYYIVAGIGTCTDADIVIPVKHNGLTVTQIGHEVFRDKLVNSVTIPSTITYIQLMAFNRCYSLQWIDVSDDNPYYKSIDGNLYNKDATVLIKYACGKSETVFTIPDSVVSFGNYTMAYANNLETAILGKGLTSISGFAFADCRSLKNIVLSQEATKIDNWSFQGCVALTNVYYYGTPETWQNMYIGDGNEYLENATRYYYSETQPTTEGNFWHYVDGVPTVWEAYVAPENPAYSVGLEYTPNGDGNCYVSGIGTCTDTVLRIPPVAPDGKVIGVGDFAFSGCKSIVSVELPDTIVVIGYDAFANCSSLKSIVLPNSIIDISSYAFFNCVSLESVVIPSIAVVGVSVFSDCIALKSVAILDGFKDVREGMFRNCTSLNSIIIPDSVTNIGDYTFENCYNLTNVYYTGTSEQWASISISIDNEPLTTATRYYYSETEPTTEGNFWHYVDGKPVVWTIGGLFDANGNMLASWNDLVTKYGLDVETDLLMAFASSTTTSIAYILNNNSEFASATKLVISGSVKRIGSWSLENKQLTTIEFAYGVTELGRFSLACCSSMVEIIIPDSVTTISERAISFCNGLKIVTLPDSVTLIGNGAFYGCSSLESIVIPKSVTTIEYYAFNDCPLKNIYYLGNASEWANINNYNRPDINPNFENATVYYYCENLPTESGDFWHYVDGVPAIWKYYNDPNYSKGLEYSIIDDETCAVVGIGTCTDTDLIIPAIAPDGRFVVAIRIDNGYYNLTSISIPSTVTEINSNAILWSDRLSYISVDNHNEYYKSIDGNLYSKDGKTLIRYTHKDETSFEIPYGVTTIGENAFYNMGRNIIKTIIIPDTVTSIGKWAFAYCARLAHIEIPSNVTEIKDQAFYMCNDLSYVVIPKSLICLDCSIFSQCQNLNTIYYTGTESDWQQMSISNFEDINNDYRSCKIFYYSPTPPTTEGNLWHYVNGVPTVWEIDNTVYSRGLEFKSNGNGTCYVTGIGTCTDSEIVIPKYSPEGDVVKAIGDAAFNDCAGITSIIIPEGVTRIGSNAFKNCSSLKKVLIPESVEYMSNSPFANCTAIEEIVFVDPVGWYYQYPMEVAISADALSDPKTAAVTLMTNVPSIASFIKR